MRMMSPFVMSEGEKSFFYSPVAPAREPRKAARTLRVASWNVECGRDAGRVADAILDNDHVREADIILLQEIEAHEREERPRAERIAAACGFDCLYAPARAAGERGTHGLAILTRHALSDVHIVPLMFQNLVFHSRERVGIACTLSVNGEMVRVYNVHLDTRINSAARLSQMRPVIDDALSFREGRAVIAGDFNTLPLLWAKNIIPVGYSNQRKRFDAELERNGFMSCVTQSGCTMRQGPVRFRLDSIFAKGFSVTGCGIESSVRASDHMPIWADLELSARSS